MSRTATPRRVAAPPRGRRAVTVAGVVALVLALGALGWTAYDVFVRPPVDPVASARARADLRAAWESPASGAGAPASGPQTVASPAPGEPFALLRIPRFGDDFEQPVLAGTDDATLRAGVGWYDGTAAPGEVGNFAVAGHRGLRGPFAPIGTLVPGDEVVVETRDAVHTYALTNAPASTTVSETDTWVIQPVPGRPEVRPTEALLTLTTGQDLFHPTDRAVAFARLVATAPK